MIAFEAAVDAVVAACAPLALESVPLALAVGRIAGRTLYAQEDLVPFARSAMDGYAVRSRDLATLPVTLPLENAVFAGPAAAQQRQHAPGTATAIATGAALPFGADAVVPFEDVEVVAGAVRFGEAVLPGDAIFPPGEDARAGDVLIARGASVTPATLGLLAAAGHSHLDVHRRPRVTLVCGGDELVPVEAQPGYGQIRNSNAPLLAALLTAFGADVRATVTVEDDREHLRTALRNAFAQSDLVVTTGGASVGPKDYVKELCREAGAAFAFETVALRPAKPSAFGVVGDVAVAVLPGNPAAAFVGLQLLVRPAVRALMGAADVRLPVVTARLAGAIRAKPERHFAAFAALFAGPAGFVAQPLENQCSSLSRTLADACGFIVVPPGPRSYGDGDAVAFTVVDWSKLQVATRGYSLTEPAIPAT